MTNEQRKAGLEFRVRRIQDLIKIADERFVFTLPPVSTLCEFLKTELEGIQTLLDSGEL